MNRFGETNRYDDSYTTVGFDGCTQGWYETRGLYTECAGTIPPSMQFGTVKEAGEDLQSSWTKLPCITRNWHNVPVETPDVVVQPIGRITNETGIEIHGWLDERTCRKGRTVADRDLAGCCFKRHTFHGEGIMKSIHTAA